MFNIEKNLKKIKTKVLSKWIDVRANAFVKTFVLIFKRKMNNMLNDKKKQQLRSSEPAMRKTLT